MSENEENKNPDKVQEPWVSYGTGDKQIVFFTSFDAQEQYHLKNMAEQKPEASLNKLEQIRMFFYRNLLLPDGTWPPLSRTIKLNKPVA